MNKIYLLLFGVCFSLVTFGQTQSLSYVKESAGPSASTTIDNITTCQLSATLNVYSSGWDGSVWANTTSNIYINGSLAFSNVPAGTTLNTTDLAAYLPINNVQIYNNWGLWGYVQGTLTITSSSSDVPVVATLSSTIDHVCANGTATIPATIAGTGVSLRYYWGPLLQNSSTTPPTIDTSTPGIYYYYVSQVNATGCESARVKYSLIVGNPSNCDWLEYTEDNAGFGSNVTLTPSTCASNVFLAIYASRFTGSEWLGSDVTLTVNGSNLGTYSGDTIVNLSSYMPISSIVMVNNAGTWSYTNGHLHVSQDATITPASPTVADVEYCILDVTSPLSAVASTNNTLRWYSNQYGMALSTSAPTPSSSVAGTTDYYVAQVTPAGCESLRDVITVTINELPIVNAGTDFSVCEGDQVTLNGSGADSYSWTNSVVNNIAFTPTSTDTYTVTGTDANGCENTDAITVTVNPLPVVVAGADQTICEGNSVTLSGSGAVDYTWDNGVTDGMAFTPALGDVTYTVIGTDDMGCEDTDMVTISVVDCAGIEELNPTSKKLKMITDLLGRETNFAPNTPLIYIYEDGSMQRVFKAE